MILLFGIHAFKDELLRISLIVTSEFTSQKKFRRLFVSILAEFRSIGLRNQRSTKNGRLSIFKLKRPVNVFLQAF